VFVPTTADEVVYHPRLIAAADMLFNSARYHIEEEKSALFAVEFEDGPVNVDWDNCDTMSLSLDQLQSKSNDNATFAPCPSCAAVAKNYTAWGREFKQWVRQNETITLYRSKKFALTSEAGETEGDFRARLQIAANEKRDQAVAKIRKRYASKTTTLDNRLLRSQQAVERESQQASKKKLDTAVSFGTAILGALLGRKRISSTSAGKFGTAIRSASGARKESADIKRAEETVRKVKSDIEALSRELQKEIAALETGFNAQTEELKEIVVRAKATDIHVPLLGLAWMPYKTDANGRLEPAW
jgi:hypothetical protein